MKAVNNFAGLNGFVWWTGQVVDNADPLGVGRCKVRIFGWHTDNKSLIPNSDLPWAHPVHSINTPYQFQTLRIGEWVLGFFMDGESGQFPIMFGVIPAIAPASTPKTKK